MTSEELRELYQQLILDHYKNPRNFSKPDHFNHYAEGHNPLCGDQLEIFLTIDETGIVEKVHFLGNGCAISKASASLMSSVVKGRHVDEIKFLFDAFHDLITGKEVEEERKEKLGKLAVLQGVKEFPMRVKCATLSWHTLISAIKNDSLKATTE